jgi:putative ABC transport system ATP-binding protein
MIELEGIEKTFGEGESATRVLKGLSFRIEAGEYIAIMGASGTGKSTLMNILGCLDKPTAGKYSLDGIDTVTMDDAEQSQARNRKIGFVFQQFHLLDRISARGNVMLPLIYSDDYPDDAEDKAKKALESVGLGHRIDNKPNTLSGGEQQRVAIARALIADPAIILADEPTGNLDSKSGIEILTIFKKLHKENKTIILVTHDRNVAEHTDRIITLVYGNIDKDETVSEPRDAEAELETITEKENA